MVTHQNAARPNLLRVVLRHFFLAETLPRSWTVTFQKYCYLRCLPLFRNATSSHVRADAILPHMKSSAGHSITRVCSASRTPFNSFQPLSSRNTQIDKLSRASTMHFGSGPYQQCSGACTWANLSQHSTASIGHDMPYPTQHTKPRYTQTHDSRAFEDPICWGTRSPYRRGSPRPTGRFPLATNVQRDVLEHIFETYVLGAATQILH